MSLLLLIEEEMTDNLVLVSGVQQSDSVLYIYIHVCVYGPWCIYMCTVYVCV